MPEDGYLGNEKKILDDDLRMNKIIKAIRGNEVVRYVPPEQYIKSKNKIEDTNEKKKMKIKKDMNDVELFGDN